MSRRTALWILTGSLLALNCQPGGAPKPPPEAPSAARRYAPTREDTPWRKMSDEDLARAVREAEGRVFIGFKEPSARGGVDNQGRVLVSDSTVARGIELLESHGIWIERKGILTPVVVAHIDPSLVAVLRHHPLIDYIEPVFPGKFN